MSSYIILRENGIAKLYRNVANELDVQCGPILIPIVWNVDSDVSFSVDALESPPGFS